MSSSSSAACMQRFLMQSPYNQMMAEATMLDSLTDTTDGDYIKLIDAYQLKFKALDLSSQDFLNLYVGCYDMMIKKIQPMIGNIEAVGHQLLISICEMISFHYDYNRQYKEAIAWNKKATNYYKHMLENADDQSLAADDMQQAVAEQAVRTNNLASLQERADKQMTIKSNIAKQAGSKPMKAKKNKKKEKSKHQKISDFFRKKQQATAANENTGSASNSQAFTPPLF